MSMPTIPLRCTLCPKQPTFSDVSHLLTHISSKGHLSCYFRQKVRASSDAETRATVDEFDTWYSEWNIDALMADRLNLKDKKNKIKNASKRNTPSRASPASALGRVAQSGARTANLSRSNSQPSPYNTQLDTTQIKREASHSPWTPGHHQHPYGQAYNLRQSTTSRQLNYADSPYGSDASGFSGYPDPSQSHATADQYENSSYFSGSHGTPNLKSQEDSDDDLPVVEDEWDSRRNTAKLKGVVWPGMAIFDSATPEARRRRNQKKPVAVLNQLETNSCNVENLESVWHPNGDLKKSKEISGLPSSSSPIMSPPSVLANRNSGFTMSDFHRQPYADTPASARMIASGRYESSNRTHSSGKAKRDFEAYHDGEDNASQASFEQPMNISYLTRGVSSHHDADDIEARPARRRMRDDGHLDNRPYENMSGAQVNKTHVNASQGKNSQKHTVSVAPSHTNVLKQATEKMLPPGYVVGQGNYGRQSSADSATQRNGYAASRNNDNSRAHLPEEYLRAVGSQFIGNYGPPGVFSNNLSNMNYHGHAAHGGQARRSVGSVNIEDIVNNYHSGQQVFVPNGAYPGMPNQNYNYGQQGLHGYGAPISGGFDIGQLMGLGAQAQHSTAGTWNFEETGAVPNSVEPRSRPQSDQHGATSEAESANDYGSKSGSNKEQIPSDHSQGLDIPVAKATNIASTPTTATEDDGRTVTAPASSPSA